MDKQDAKRAATLAAAAAVGSAGGSMGADTVIHNMHDEPKINHL